MNRIFYFIVITTFILSACNNNKSKGNNDNTRQDSTTGKTNDPKKDPFRDIEDQKEKLAKLTPLPADQLKAMVPEMLMGAKIMNPEVSDAIGANAASGEYEINDSTRITLNIYDCAGPAGSGIYGLQFVGLMNDLHDNNDEYLKAVDFNGGQAYEQCDKTTHDCTFSYFSGGRYLVTLEGEHAGAEVLKQAAKGLNIK